MFVDKCVGILTKLSRVQTTECFFRVPGLFLYTVNILFLKIPIKGKTTCRGAFGSVFILVNFC